MSLQFLCSTIQASTALKAGMQGHSIVIMHFFNCHLKGFALLVTP